MITTSIKFKHRKTEHEITVVLPTSVMELQQIMTSEEILAAVKQKLIKDAMKAAVRKRPAKRYVKIDMTTTVGREVLSKLDELGISLESLMKPARRKPAPSSPDTPQTTVPEPSQQSE